MYLFTIALPLFFPSIAGAYNILFYYNSKDGTDGAILQCVAVLQTAGHHVTTIDVKGTNRNPQNDDWGAPYDQVWDMRFVNRDVRPCGSGRPNAADYFDDHWRSKSVSFLNHCGKLFIGAEYYLLPDRDEGLYRFLKDIVAVKKEFDSCPPSIQGNNSTTGEAFYPVRHGLGPVSFYGAWVGGIPVALLTGTNFVDTSEDWETDAVDRSIVSGWDGGQLGGAVNAVSCNRGKLFMVWDATMWTLWQPGMYEEEESESPIWDDSSWTPGNIQPPLHTDKYLRSAKRVTTAFFPAIAKWLGTGGGPCTETSLPAVSPTSTTVTTVGRPSPTPPRLTSMPVTAGSLLSVATSSAAMASPGSSNAPATMVFSVFPVNIYMGFRDGVGEYQLSIWDSHGGLIQTIFDRSITTEKESWAAWDGTTGAGIECAPGLYYAVLSKDGGLLRKIVLLRVKP